MASDTEWSERVEQSGARAALGNLRSKLQGSDRSEVGPPLAHSLERADQILVVALDVLDKADPALVPLQSLTAVTTAASQLDATVDQALAAATSDAQEQQAPTLDTAADGLLVPLAQIIVRAPDAEAASTFESLESARRSIGQRRRHIEEALEDLRAQVTQLQEQITTFTAGLEETKTQHDASLTDQLESARTQVGELDAEITAQKTRLEEALTQQSETFREAQDERATAFQDMLKEKRQAADTKTDEALGEVLEQANTILADIKVRQDEVEKVAGAVGGAALAARFKTTADNEEASATAWRRGAVGATVILAIAGIFGLWLTATNGVDAVDTLAVRSMFFTPLLILAGYCARQSGHHRKAARRYRAAHLDLLAVDPFLAKMTDEEQRQTVRAVVALRWFGSDSPLTPTTKAADQLSERLAQRMLDRAERKRADDATAA